MGNVANWEPTTATLVDGTVVCGRSEAWRAECEARAVLRMSDDVRADFFQRASRARGREAMDKLQSLMDAIEHAFILNEIPTRNARRAYLQRVELRRGRARRMELEQSITTLWNSRKNVASDLVGET